MNRTIVELKAQEMWLGSLKSDSRPEPCPLIDLCFSEADHPEALRIARAMEERGSDPEVCLEFENGKARIAVVLGTVEENEVVTAVGEADFKSDEVEIFLRDFKFRKALRVCLVTKVPRRIVWGMEAHSLTR